MSVQRDQCPPDLDEMAEMYCLGLLSREDAEAFEDHYMICPQCADGVQAEEQYVRAMQAAAHEMRAERSHDQPWSGKSSGPPGDGDH
jgi:anti-sigma factor RsiW